MTVITIALGLVGIACSIVVGSALINGSLAKR